MAGHETFEVADHDFTKFSIVPSVSFIVQIPETMESSWYDGLVHVGYKDAVLEHSTALRHASELYSILLKQIENKSILFLYPDGGPDHQLTFFSVQLSLIALFLNLDLDLLVVGRTAPNHSWKNPVERIMSIINLGLQCVGMMRSKGSEEFEKAIKTANGVNALREADWYGNEMKSSLRPAVQLLNSITSRLELHGKPFSVFESADSNEIDPFWEVLHQVDCTLEKSETSKSVLSN